MAGRPMAAWPAAGRRTVGSWPQALLAGLVLLSVGCTSGATDAGALPSAPSLSLPAIAGLAVPATLATLERHTFACSGPLPDPAIALVSYSCETVVEALDTTATSMVSIEASPDGMSIYSVGGRVAIRAGTPDDDLAIALCGNVLGSLPFAEPTLPDLVEWISAQLRKGATGRFGAISLVVSGLPRDRRCVFAATDDG